MRSCRRDQTASVDRPKLLSRSVSVIFVLLVFFSAVIRAGASSQPSDAELAAITARGVLLAEYDTAEWQSTDALTAAHPVDGLIGRYIARKTDAGWVVDFGRLDGAGDKFLVAYEAAQTLALLKSDAQTAVSFVNRRLSTSVTQTQFDALTDVAFNSERAAGILVNRVNSSETIGPANFVNTLPHGYNSPPGLINRREDEATLFLRGDYQ